MRLIPAARTTDVIAESGNKRARRAMRERREVIYLEYRVDAFAPWISPMYIDAVYPEAMDLVHRVIFGRTS